MDNGRHNPIIPSTGPEQARLFKIEHGETMDCLTARFRTSPLAKHAHDHLTLGVIQSGGIQFTAHGRHWNVMPGEITTLTDGTTHDCAPIHENGYTYRALWPTQKFLRHILEDATEKTIHDKIWFPIAKAKDPELFSALSQAHHNAEIHGDNLGTDERLLAAFTQLVVRHGRTGTPLGDIVPNRRQQENTPIAKAMDYLNDHYNEDIDLHTLAQIANIPRTRLIRTMKQKTGMTPHAWLTNRRIEIARTKLRRGETLADVATDCGFCDQSHLNRAFKARLGITPGAYRDAHLS